MIIIILTASNESCTGACTLGLAFLECCLIHVKKNHCPAGESPGGQQKCPGRQLQLMARQVSEGILNHPVPVKPLERYSCIRDPRKDQQVNHLAEPSPNCH